MNIAFRMSRQALLRSRGIHRFQRRAFGEHQPLSKPGQFNMIQRKGHGFVNYIREWEVLIFCHKDYRMATLFIWGPSAFATAVMFYCIWNSAWRDPESRLRPHKKAWHISDAKLVRGELYRGGAFIWLPIRANRKRLDYLRNIHRNGFDEPGQIGYEEAPIPKLDD